MYDFPLDPIPGQEFTPPVGGQTYVWQPPRWLVKGIPPASGGGGGGIPEAPIDSQQYAREDADWTVVEPGVSDWADITGKPATFPPTVPIAQSDVTNLTTDLTARVLKAGDTMTGPLVLPQGSVAAPALKFTGTQVNGISADNFTLKFTTTGQLALALDPNYADFSFPIRVPLGAPAGPSFRFSGTSAAGFYGIASPNGVGVNGALTLAADPTAPLMAATKQYVDTMDANKAPLASPVFTGNPTAPTPAIGDNDTSLATTEFVKAQGYAPLASPVFTGNPTAPTPTTADNDTSVATTAYVKAQGYVADAPNNGVMYARKNAGWASFYFETPSDNTLYGYRNSFPRKVSEPPLTSAFYIYKNTYTSVGMANGEFRVDNSYWPDITKCWIATQDLDSGNWGQTIQSIQPGWFILPRQRGLATNAFILKVTGTPVLNGLFYEIPVDWVGGLQGQLNSDSDLNVTFIPGGNFVSKSGDTMTGTLVISNGNVEVAKPGGYPGLYFNYDSSFGGYLQVTKAYAPRYEHYFDDTAYYFKKYNDAGVGVNAFTLNRSDGLITLLGNPTAALGIATKQYVDAVAGSFASDRSLIVNGNCIVSQENAATAGTTSGYNVADQWIMNFNVVAGSGVQFTETNASIYGISIHNTAAVASLGVGDYLMFQHNKEGIDFQSLKWGTANAIPAVINFKARSGRTGVFGFAIRDSTAAFSFVKQINITQANVWQEFTFSIPACTVGTWQLASTAHGGSILFTHSSGSTYKTATEGAWTAGNFLGPNAMTNNASVITTVFHIREVQLCADPLNTGKVYPFVAKRWHEELNECARYYWKPAGKFLIGGYCAASGNQFYGSIAFPVPMRITPAITFSNQVYNSSSGLVTSGASPPSNTNASWYATSNAASGAANCSFNAVFNARL